MLTLLYITTIRWKKSIGQKSDDKNIWSEKCRSDHLTMQRVSTDKKVPLFCYSEDQRVPSANKIILLHSQHQRQRENNENWM